MKVWRRHFLIWPTAMPETPPDDREAMLKMIERLLAENLDLQRRIEDSKREISRMKKLLDDDRGPSRPPSTQS